MELLRVKATWYLGAALIAITAVLAGSAVRLGAQQAASAVPIDGDDIGGVVTGPNGPEAGVWVIAETTDLPTKFARMVVTDDQGKKPIVVHFQLRPDPLAR
jgi:hypothetical protein